MQVRHTNHVGSVDFSANSGLRQTVIAHAAEIAAVAQTVHGRRRIIALIVHLMTVNIFIKNLFMFHNFFTQS
jgi:hypothetical protein